MQQMLLPFDITRARSFLLRTRLNWYLADQVIVSGANFALSVVIARLLGIEGFGVYWLAWIVVLFVQSLQMALIVSPMMSIGPKQAPEASAGYFAVVVAHQLIFCASATALVLAGSLLVGGLHWVKGMETLTIPLTLTIAPILLQEFLRRYNFTLDRVERVLISDIIRYGALFGGLLLSASPGSVKHDVAGVLYLTAASALIALIPLAWNVPSLRHARARFADVTARHFNISRWLIGSAILYWATSNFFVVAAGIVLGPVGAAALRATQALMSVTNIYFQAAEGFAPARAARAYHEQGVVGLTRFINLLTGLGLAATTLACVVLVPPAGFWLKLVFGPAFVQYEFLVAGFGVYFFFIAFLMPLRYAFQAAERSRPDFNGFMCAAFFTLIASFPLLHAFGLYGAIGGMIAAEAIMLANLAYSYRQFRKTSA